MRNRIMAVVVLAMMVALLAFSAPAFASHVEEDHQGPPDPEAHPFCTSGADYAEFHIVGLAQDQLIKSPFNAGGVHNPGLAHQGFAVCDPTDNDPFE